MATIQGIYVALFGRPADPAGLAFFNEATNNGANLTAIGDLASTAEYQDRFTGMDNTEIVNSIYQSLFERDGEPAGVAFWVELLESGGATINDIAIRILDGAQGDDLATVNAKIAAANIFTAQLDSAEEVRAYSGEDAAQVGRDYIDSINASTPGDTTGADAAILKLFPDEGQTPGGGAGGGATGGGAIGGGGVSDVTAPVFTSSKVVRVDENIGDGAEVYRAIASDAEGVVEYSLRGDGASQFSIDPTTGVVTIKNNPNFEDEDEYSFIVVAKDAAGNTASQTVDVFIDDVNEAPSLVVDQSVTEVNENNERTLIAEFQVSDVDAGDAVTLSIDSDVFELDAGALYLKADVDFETLEANPITVTLTATDLGGLSTSQTIEVAVLDVNEAPSIELEQTETVVTENNDKTMVAVIRTSDQDADDEITLSIVGEYFTLEGNEVHLAAGIDFDTLTEADLEFTVTATDSKGLKSEVSGEVTIADEESTVYSYSSMGAKTISDFNVFEDSINVSAIDAKAFDFWNNFEFVNNVFSYGGKTEGKPAFGQLVWRHDGGNTIVEADNSYGSDPNLVITITGIHDLTEAHFVL